MKQSTRFAAMMLGVLGLVAFLAIGARCIENTSVRRGPGGDWRLYGEIHNETDVQATEVLVVGTLLDAAGNTLATGQAAICPRELSPGSFSAYDIAFRDTAALPEPASYRVNVLSGKTLESALPPLDVTLSNLEATRSGDTVTITGSVRANEDYPGDYSGCAAFYNSSGAVVQHLTIIGFGQLEDGVRQPLELPMPLIPDDATSLRFWLVGPGQAPFDSDFRAVLSDEIQID